MEEQERRRWGAEEEQLQKREVRKGNKLRSSYDGRASLSFMRETSSYSATDTTSSMGQIRPYSSQPCSITRGSDLWGSNMMLLGVTISTPPTTPCNNNIRQTRQCSGRQQWRNLCLIIIGPELLSSLLTMPSVKYLQLILINLTVAGLSSSEFGENSRRMDFADMPSCRKSRKKKSDI